MDTTTDDVGIRKPLAVLAEDLYAVEAALEEKHGFIRGSWQHMMDEDEADIYYGDQDDWREDR